VTKKDDEMRFDGLVGEDNKGGDGEMWYDVYYHLLLLLANGFKELEKEGEKVSVKLMDSYVL